jgi:hypothetical protein
MIALFLLSPPQDKYCNSTIHFTFKFFSINYSLPIKHSRLYSVATDSAVKEPVTRNKPFSLINGRLCKSVPLQNSKGSTEMRKSSSCSCAYLSKDHIIRTYLGLEDNLTILDLALDSSKWSASRSSDLTPVNSFVDPRAGLDTVEKRKVYFACLAFRLAAQGTPTELSLKHTSKTCRFT